MSISISGTTIAGPIKCWAYRAPDCGDPDCQWRGHHDVIRRSGTDEGEIRRRAANYTDETGHTTEVVVRTIYVPEWENENAPKTDKPPITEVPL